MQRDSITSCDTCSKPLEDNGYAGEFQNPEAVYADSRPRILQRLVIDPLNTWYFEVASDEMELFGIKQGALLVVDRSIKPAGGMIVVALNQGEWLVRQLITHVKRKYLTTGKEEDPVVEIEETSGIIIWGVVTWSCCPQVELKSGIHQEAHGIR